MAELPYVDKPRMDRTFKFILGSVWFLVLVLGVGNGLLMFMKSGDRLEAMAAIGLSLAVLLLIHGVIPHRYEIQTDRVLIVLGWPFYLSLPFESIESVTMKQREDAFSGAGIRLVCSSRGIVAISRRKGFDVIISPADGRRFMARLEQALTDGERCR